jgi:hypothetical protein
MLLKEQYDVLVKSLLPYAQKKLGFNKPPRINFIEDEQNSKDPLGRTAYYRPEDKEITIFVTNRHPKDILRSVAHELVHYKQDCDGRLTNNLKNDLQDQNYTQNSPQLRMFEEEAYLKGNMIFRDWEDNYKNPPKQIIKITKEPKEMNESTLRNHIRKMISDILSEEKKKEEQRADVSKVRDSAKKEKLSQYKIAEEVEEDSTLNEWKNQELFGLLTKRFGILSEGAKPDFLDLDKDGNKKEPMKQAAKQAKAKKKVGKTEIGEDTEEETPEQKRKREKQEASAKYKEAEESQYQKPQGKSQKIQEKKMTKAEKEEEEKLGKKMEKAGVQAKFEEQYGKEQGKKRYFATKRARAMENA